MWSVFNWKSGQFWIGINNLRTKAHIEGHFVICFFCLFVGKGIRTKIKEALNSLEFSEIEIEKEKYYLKGKQIDLASKILSVFKIKQPNKLLTNEQVVEYLSL